VDKTTLFLFFVIKLWITYSFVIFILSEEKYFGKEFFILWFVNNKKN